MFCTKCGTQIPDGSKSCSVCGQQFENLPNTVNAANFSVGASADAAAIAKKARDAENTYGTLWLVLGIFQCISIVFIIAGIWNIINSIQQKKNAVNIQPGNPNIPPYFERRKTSLVIAGIFNVFFGGVIGVILVVMEYSNCQYVISNRSAFEQ